MQGIKIVGLGGSSNPRSSTHAALETALAGAREAGAEVVHFNVSSMDLPIYKYGLTTPAAEELVAAVRAAHGMIWCSPLYHGTVSGAFKNAVDWLEMLARDVPPYLSNKVIGLIATAGGDQPLQAINTMEYMVRSLRGWTFPLTVPIPRADTAFDTEGALQDEALDQRLRLLGGEVAGAAEKWSR